MTNEQMIVDFQEQIKKVVDEIKELDTQISAKKEQYFRLQGAIEALNLVNRSSESSSSEASPTETTQSEVVQ